MWKRCLIILLTQGRLKDAGSGGSLQESCLNGSWVTLLMIQDLLVVGEAVAELTATLPLAAWQRESPYEAFLMSLQPLPEQQGVLHTTVDVAPAKLDEWATERDKAPREALTVQVKPDLAPPWATISLTKADFDAFERMVREYVRFRADPSEVVDRRLMAANLFDEVGKPTEIGSWIRKIMLRGNSWKAEKAMQYPASFRVWAMGNSSLIVTTSPDAGAGLMQCSIEYCPTEDIGRHLLVWSGLQPSWAMKFTMKISKQAFENKIDGDVCPSAVFEDDAAVFCRESWGFVLLSDSRGVVGLVGFTLRPVEPLFLRQVVMLIGCYPVMILNLSGNYLLGLLLL